MSQTHPPPTTPVNWLSPILKSQTGPESFTFQSWQNHSQEARPVRGKGFSKPESQLKFPKLGEIRDAEGILWDVRTDRSTKHGFHIFFGTPTFHEGGFLSGKLHLIATIDLIEFWIANCTKGHGVLYDLPAGRTTLKRLRRRLGFNFKDDIDEFWEDRIADLVLLSPAEFALKHGVSRAVVSDRSRKIFGRSARAVGWWRKPRFIAVLLSGQTLVRIGLKLGISCAHASRLRTNARQEYGTNRVNANLVSFRASLTLKGGDYNPPIAA
jgi:hypothetical protein